MNSNNAKGYDYALSYSLFEAMKDKESKRLQFAKCPSCNKVNSFRLTTLKDSALICKSCKTPIAIDRHEESPWTA